MELNQKEGESRMGETKRGRGRSEVEKVQEKVGDRARRGGGQVSNYRAEQQRGQ